MEKKEIEKGHVFVLADVVEYVPNTMTSHTILMKATGRVSLASIDSREIFERTSPFDKLLIVIDGIAKVTIDGKSFTLDTGHAIIVPAHARNTIVGTDRFKIMSTIIKSGYEEVIM